jgi:integrating conjugative element protein (TIGR03765 family)
MRILMSLVLFAWFGAAAAAPPIWAVLGPTVPINSPLGENQNKPVPPKITALSYADMVARSLPIRSSIRPGHLDRFRSATANRVTQPLCLVGYDDYSLAWLEQNRSALERFDAVCFVMSADNLEQIRRIKQVAGKVLVQPVSGEQIARDFKVTSYPALIYDGWVIQ